MSQTDEGSATINTAIIDFINIHKLRQLMT